MADIALDGPDVERGVPASISKDLEHCPDLAGIAGFFDASGGAGHDIRQLFKVCPETASRLYLQDLENVLNSSSANATAPTEIQQQVVMAFLGAQERTQREWKSLLDSVGLRVAKVWKSPGGTYGIIEAEWP
ncbi:hypothetical protein QIS74_00046 [Colletotrichum tabaci]|uniref:O-methyltransferase domain-containing protein n=1 Tax=Colletotrichum tabaci TaxID=1209068 RepID=A0AAV9TW07_9PEZI